jgi:CTP:molybdopterin cytidylyltransferase MocA
MQGVVVAGILLAAGSASRMGSNKLLLELGGEPMVRRVARRALEGGLDPLLVVVGHEEPAVRAALSGLPCRLVPCPEWHRGQSASLAAGVGALPADAGAAVVVLADMPLVDPDAIRAVVRRWREGGALLVSCRYGEVAAPPTLYDRSLWPELVALEGDRGGRDVVRRHADRVGWVECPAAALSDVDLPEDLERARSVTGPGEPAPADDRSVLEQALAWRDEGVGVALATVTTTWGSSPRPPGSQLVVNERGDFAGSVSGGCVEAAVITAALEAIRDGKARRLGYGVTNERAWELGLACGGRIEVYVERVG